ncbi:hypothetical protein TNIN_413561 [Trichonephila inaurata madagascariensis]|uniref:Uncharacterized protein n=1 Tax=Trichonephila inaurata madagascariensis TaxID=2747483 RepID=A0A8X7CTI6_9ARAC|nr:hypothetical protein TNIN_413561 [Trichonephila inaurata madagascariensis]
MLYGMLPLYSYVAKLYHTRIKAKKSLNDIVWMQEDVPPCIEMSLRRVLELQFGTGSSQINFHDILNPPSSFERISGLRDISNLESTGAVHKLCCI